MVNLSDDNEEDTGNANPFDVYGEDSEQFGEQSQEGGIVTNEQNNQGFFPLGDEAAARFAPDARPFRSELTHIRDVTFVADIFVGSPMGQRSRVVLDSGSSWLTIKSCVTSRLCNKSQKVVYDAVTKKPKMLPGGIVKKDEVPEYTYRAT